MLGIIFRKAQNKIQDPAKLRRLIVDLIDKEQWSSLTADVKGDAYEGLLEKNAADVKGGAGQYFTPRALIAAMVDVMAPQKPGSGHGGDIKFAIPPAARADFCWRRMIILRSILNWIARKRNCCKTARSLALNWWTA
jgi:hypothetical protein